MKDCLRVSEIIGCKRKIWFNGNGTEPLPAHPISLAGTELHEAIYEDLQIYIRAGKHIKPVFNFADNIQKFNNYLLVFETLNLDNGIILEKRFYSPHNKPKITGKIDMFMNGVIYDWKSASFWRQPMALQLSGYAFLLKENNITIKSACNVLLGGYKPQIVIPQLDEQKFLKEYDIAFEALISNKLTAPEWSYVCIFCEYIHCCRMKT